MEAMKEVGKVTHFYGKIGVAIIELTGGLKVGDAVKFEKGDSAVEQVIGSMQIEHKSVTEAKAGDVVGVETSAKVDEGARVVRVS